jgi:hypothetical protein
MVIFHSYVSLPEGSVGKLMEIYGGLSWEFMGSYPLVNVQKTMENHHAIHRKTHYFSGHFQ